MKFIKEHTLTLMLAIMTLVMMGLLVASISFTWRQQDIIDTQTSTIEEQRLEITSLSAEKSVLEKEVEDLKSTFENLKIDVDTLQEFQNEMIEQLKKLYP